MKLVLVFLCVSIVHSLTKRYQITFPGGDTFSYAKLYGTIDRPLKDFTLCHWSRSNVNNNLRAAVFSYATNGAENSILSCIQHNRNIRFHRNLAIRDVVINTPNTNWLHICATWSIVENTWQIYINGERIANGNWTSDNIQPVLPNGVAILGQDQDKLEGGFDIKQSLTGQVSELHLWDYILTSSKIFQISKCDYTREGNIIAWNEVTWALYNGSRISPVDLPCGQL